MITEFKIFENKKSKDYEDKFFISPCYMREYEWEEKDFYIVLVKDVDFNWHDHTGKVIWPKGDSFTVMKNGKIKDPAGWGYQYKTIEELDNLGFMTAEEFYDKHTELCEKLYWFILHEYDKVKDYDQQNNLYPKTINFYKRVLETAPQLEHFKNARKYNL
jgi:hypothetical protein